MLFNGNKLVQCTIRKAIKISLVVLIFYLIQELNNSKINNFLNDRVILSIFDTYSYRLLIITYSSIKIMKFTQWRNYKTIKLHSARNDQVSNRFEKHSKHFLKFLIIPYNSTTSQVYFINFKLSFSTGNIRISTILTYSGVRRISTNFPNSLQTFTLNEPNYHNDCHSYTHLLLKYWLHKHVFTFSTAHTRRTHACENA